MGYSVKWPDLDATGKADRAKICLTRTQALAAYVQAGAESIMAPHDYLTREMDYDEEEADEIVEATTKHLEDSYPEPDEGKVLPGHKPEPPAPPMPPMMAGPGGAAGGKPGAPGAPGGGGLAKFMPGQAPQQGAATAGKGSAAPKSPVGNVRAGDADGDLWLAVNEELEAGLRGDL